MVEVRAPPSVLCSQWLLDDGPTGSPSVDLKVRRRPLLEAAARPFERPDLHVTLSSERASRDSFTPSELQRTAKRQRPQTVKPNTRLGNPTTNRADGRYVRRLSGVMDAGSSSS